MQSLRPARLRILVASLLAVAFLGALDHTIVATGLATIAGELGALDQMSWVIVSYTLASTVLLPILGKLGDIVGPRRVYLGAVALFLVASLACGLAQTMPQLLAGRVAQGIGAAGVQLMAQTIVARVASPRETPRLLSIVGLAFPIAIVLGPLVGGLIVDHWGWRWIFWVNLPIGLIALAFAWFAVPTIRGTGSRRLDLAGAASLTVTLVALVLGLTWAPDPARLPVVIAAFVLAACGAAAFITVELRAPDPIVPVRLLAGRQVGASAALSLVIGVGLFSVVSFIPTYIQLAYRTSATVSGLVPMATVFGMLVSNLASGMLASRTGRYRVFPVAGTAFAALGLGTMAVLPAGLPLWVPMAVMAAVGIGTGAFMNIIVAVGQAGAPIAATGSITATVNLVRQIGATVGTAVIGGLVAAGVAARLPAALDPAHLTPQAVQAEPVAVQLAIADAYGAVFAPVFAALAAVYAAGVVFALVLPGGPLASHRADAPPSPPTPVAEAPRHHEGETP